MQFQEGQGQVGQGLFRKIKLTLNISSHEATVLNSLRCHLPRPPPPCHFTGFLLAMPTLLTKTQYTRTWAPSHVLAAASGSGAPELSREAVAFGLFRSASNSFSYRSLTSCAREHETNIEALYNHIEHLYNHLEPLYHLLGLLVLI